ncbi:alpha-amylase [bacterium]|nr:alpha-amylase [bacterium]
MISSVSDFNIANQPISSVSAPVAQAVKPEATAVPLPSDTLVRSEDPGKGLMTRSIFASVTAQQAEGPAEVASTQAVQTASVDSWHQKWGSQVIYFPFTDRFNDGDPSNNFNINKGSNTGYHGGDLRGIIDKLDYLEDLGTTCIWLSPLYDNVEEAYGGTGYHGYWIQDHYKVDEHWGTMADAKELVAKAHEKGMKVVLDTVLNQVAPGHSWTTDPSKHEWLHHNGGVTNWNDQWQVENCDLCGLPDINQSNPETYEFLLNNTLWWIKETGADGIRLDAVKHIDHQFWQKFSADIKEKMGEDFLVLGEVLHGDPNVVSNYQRDGIDSLFDMPLYYTIRDTIAKDGSARNIGNRFAEDSKYDDASKLVTLVDNHDFERFAHFAGQRGDDKMMLAMDLIMTCRGIPSIYYGDEINLEGGGDPDNRHDMRFGEKPYIADHLKKLTATRAAMPALQFGEQKEMWQDDQIYAFCRRHEGQECITVLNNSYGQQNRNIPLREGSPLHDGDVMVDVLTGEKFKIQGNCVNVGVADKHGRVLVPEKDYGSIKFK